MYCTSVFYPRLDISKSNSINMKPFKTMCMCLLYFQSQHTCNTHACIYIQTTHSHTHTRVQSMFKGLAPVSGGFGMKMMKKMGWEEGCPLGRSGQGHVEPIEVEVKMDRHGGCY